MFRELNGEIIICTLFDCVCDGGPDCLECPTFVSYNKSCKNEELDKLIVRAEADIINFEERYSGEDFIREREEEWWALNGRVDQLVEIRESRKGKEEM